MGCPRRSSWRRAPLSLLRSVASQQTAGATWRASWTAARGAAGHLGAPAAADVVRGTIACYPPVWSGEDGPAPSATVVMYRGGRHLPGGERPAFRRQDGGFVRPVLPQAREALGRRGGHRDRLAPVRAALPRPVHRRRRHHLVRGGRRERGRRPRMGRPGQAGTRRPVACSPGSAVRRTASRLASWT